jgi:hypothetical protein
MICELNNRVVDSNYYLPDLAPVFQKISVLDPAHNILLMFVILVSKI